MRALVIAALLLLAALATAPAYAQDAGTVTTPPATDPGSPPPPPADTTPPTDTPATTPDPATTTPPADTTPPASDQPATPDPSTDGSSPPATNDTSAQDAGHKQPARPADEFTTSTPASNTSATTPSSSGSGTTKDIAPPSSTSGHSDSWLGQDTFVIDKTTAKDHVGLKTERRRFAGLFLLGASTKATRIEAKVRRAHETAKISPLGSGTPVPGSPLPSQNPFFNLLSGPSGIAAGLMLASMFAVLGTALVLPRDRLRAFRTPTVTWRPLAYVPPIELPG